MNKILSVSQLNNYIKTVFEDELLLHDITVQGEVFEIKFSGANTFVTIKDGECVLSCVKFGSKLEFSVGDMIALTGTVKFYAKTGKISFAVAFAFKCGKGNIASDLEKLKLSLKADGVFDKTLHLPVFIQKVALITSSDGAVLHDFMSVLSRSRCRYIDVDVYDVRVQGDNANKMISNAVLKASAKDYDVIVVARGGGSEDDLKAFNTEDVARAVGACNIPLISAVGHEVNYTLCDFAASIRAGTPSIAAELISDNNAAAVTKIENTLKRLFEIYRSGYDKSCSDIVISSQRLASAQAAAIATVKVKLNRFLWNISDMESELINKKRNEISKFCVAQNVAVSDNINAAFVKLSEASARLDKSSPLKILSGGYAKVLVDGKSVACIGDIKEGDLLKVLLSDGCAMAKVTSKEKYEYRREP